MKIREAKKGELVPKMIYQRKDSKECDPLFFIVNVGHGMPISNEFAFIKRSLFPIENKKKA